LLVAAKSPETFLPRLAEGRWKVLSPQAFEHSPPKNDATKDRKENFEGQVSILVDFFLSKISFWHSLFSCICIRSRH